MALPATYRTRLVEKQVLTPHVRDFVFELLEPGTIEFQAGQFVLIKTNHPETGELLSRAYSVASPPHETNRLTFNVEIVEGGKLTPIMDTWQVGNEVEMQGPFGHFTLKSPPERELVFVGTGTGVAPFRSMIEALLKAGDERRMRLYFGVRHQDNVFYRELFEKLAATHPNFEFYLTLSRPHEGWDGHTGRVTQVLPEAELDPSKTDVYLCGGKPMIDDVKQILLNRGFEAPHIFFEQYFL